MSIIKIITYQTPSKKTPFTDWLDELELNVQAIIFERIVRIRLGNFGDCKRLKDGEGVWEFRVNYGPGYRIYFGKKDATIVVLLVGGDKGSQVRDITRAKKYWLEYKESSHE